MIDDCAKFFDFVIHDIGRKKVGRQTTAFRQRPPIAGCVKVCRTPSRSGASMTTRSP